VDQNERLIAELSRAVARLGLSVRSEPLWGVHAGGVCRVKGKEVLLLNTKAPPVERLIVLSDYLAHRSLEGLTLSTEARALILRRMARRSQVVSPSASTAPGLAKTEAKPGKRD
jgi:hypothetical protein